MQDKQNTSKINPERNMPRHKHTILRGKGLKMHVEISTGEPHIECGGKGPDAYGFPISKVRGEQDSHPQFHVHKTHSPDYG